VQRNALLDVLCARRVVGRGRGREFVTADGALVFLGDLAAGRDGSGW
jgi:hypothetical protein